MHGPPSGFENPGGQSQSERYIPPTDRSRISNDPVWLSCFTRQWGDGDINLFRTVERRFWPCQQTENITVKRRREKKIKEHCRMTREVITITCPVIVDMMCQDVARPGCQQTGWGSHRVLAHRTRMNKEYETDRTAWGLGGVCDGVPTKLVRSWWICFETNRTVSGGSCFF